MSDIRRFTVSFDFDGFGNGEGTEATFEITRVMVGDEQPDPIGRPRCPDFDGYEYQVELISADVGDSYELDVLEAEAIEQARRYWAQKTKEEAA
ncbi:MAG TPA: hypothetical protein VJN18_35695 [Polyangiaceae bacterium]|nr:hypothetical protein [Polyangiaceae bacterium]